MQTNRKLVTVFVLAIVVFMVAGSAASANAATIQKLPTCKDPTGHNLPCMMIISTLPAPPNMLQCQETSGQILPCSYTTQNLSNGEQIVAITVYVPANYVFTGYGPWTVVKQVIHETKTRVVHEPQKSPCEHPDADAKTDLDKNLTTVDCDINDANEHVITPPPPSCNSANYNGTCPTTNNMTVASGGKGTGPSCINNCTTGTPPPTVDCNSNPSDPSCSQQPPPKTQICPDGSQPDSSGKCPTAQLPPPSQPANPPNTSNPPSGSGSSDKSNDNSGAGGGTSGSGGESSPPSPSALP